jgi:hypothetical protein
MIRELSFAGKHKKAPDGAGAFVLLNFRQRSVLRDHRATPVEAVDQFGRRLLLPDLAVLDHRRSKTAKVRTRVDASQSAVLVVEFGEANLVLPEQARELGYGVFRAATKKPAVPGLAWQNYSGPDRRGYI